MTIFEFNDCRFDPGDGSLSRSNGESATSLRPQVARLLEYLIRRPGQVIPRDELYIAVWGTEAVVDFESGLAAILRELRRELESFDCPADTLETIPRRGCRFNATVREVSADTSQSPAQPPTTTAAPRRSWKILVSGGILAGLGLLVLVVYFLQFNASDQDEAPTRLDELSLAILPFAHFGDIEQAPAHAELLLPDNLLARLWQVELEGLILIGRTSIRPYADLEDPGRAIARDLNVTLMLEGTLNTTETEWTVDARLLAVPEGHVLWSERAERGREEDRTIRSVADELIDSLAVQWPDIRARAGLDSD